MHRMILAAVVTAILVSACGSDPFKQFYYSNSHSSSVTARRVAPPPEDPPLLRGTNPETDPQSLYKQGFVFIGYSSFNSGKVDWDDARDLARALGADAIVTYSKYTNTVSGAMPMIVPNTQTSTTTMNGTAYGPSGVVNGYGTATTTSYGNQVTYVPYSIQRSDYLALYIVKIKPILGALTQDLSDAQRQDTQSNSGVVVTDIMDGSPAFASDVLPGDIITRFNDSPIEGAQAFSMELEQYVGQTVKFTIWRNGKTLEKTITLNP